jgi:hypothetical protein
MGHIASGLAELAFSWERAASDFGGSAEDRPLDAKDAARRAVLRGRKRGGGGAAVGGRGCIKIEDAGGECVLPCPILARLATHAHYFGKEQHSMRRLLFLGLGMTLGLLLGTAPARAQGSVDASVGYSFFHLGGGADLNQNGVSGSVAYNPIPFMGVVGDFGGYHASPGGGSVNTYTFLFGPRINFKNPTHITPFAQFLVGAAHLTATGTPSATDFSYSFGGGVDLPVLPHLAVRPQVDYVGIRDSGQTANCTRVSISAVVHF